MCYYTDWRWVVVQTKWQVRSRFSHWATGSSRIPRHLPYRAPSLPRHIAPLTLVYGYNPTAEASWPSRSSGISAPAAQY